MAGGGPTLALQSYTQIWSLVEQPEVISTSDFEVFRVRDSAESDACERDNEQGDTAILGGCRIVSRQRIDYDRARIW